MATKTTDVNFTAVCDQAVQSFSDTCKGAVKMQEDAVKWWSNILDQAGPTQDWQRKAGSILNDTIPAVQKNADEWVKVFESSSNRTMNLLKKAFDGNVATNPSEVQARIQELWEESLAVLRRNHGTQQEQR